MTAANNPLRADRPTKVITLADILDMVENVTKSPPVKRGETGIFNITVDKKIISISAAQLIKGQGMFAAHWFDIFGNIIFGEKKEWPTFVGVIAERATPAPIEETSAVMAADLLFEKISDFDVSDDKTELLKKEACRVLVEHQHHNEKFLCLPSAAVAEILKEEIPIAEGIENVSQAMTARKYKKVNTYTIKVTGKVLRCWWFFADKIQLQQPENEVIR